MGLSQETRVRSKGKVGRGGGGAGRRRPSSRCIGKATKPHGLCKHCGTAMSSSVLYAEVGILLF